MHIEVRHLELVEAIHEEQTLTGASARLHLTQSALSHQLATLEARLGAKLFERTGRSMRLTSSGERLLSTASKILAELRLAEKEIQTLSRSPRGRIRLSTQCYTCYWWLPGLLKSFSREFPQVEVHIELEATRRPIEALLAGRLDLAIVNKKLSDRRLRFRLLFEDELLAVLPKGHRYAEADFMPLEALQPEHLFLHQPAADSSFVQQILLPRGIRPRQCSAVQLTEAIMEFVSHGDGVAVLAQWVVADQLRRRDVAAVRLEESGIRREWYAVTMAGRQKPPYIDALVSLLTNQGRTRLEGPAKGAARPSARSNAS